MTRARVTGSDAGLARLRWTLRTLAPGRGCRAGPLGSVAGRRRRCHGQGRGDGFGDAAAVPEPPRIDEDEARARTAPGRGHRRDRDRPRAVQPRDPPIVADLRLLLNDGPGDERYVAAGVPWFTTLFGRDSLITSLQVLAFRPQVAIETLGSWPPTRRPRSTMAGHGAGQDPPRAAVGEMAGTGETPHTPYYGTVDATPLWLMLLGATYRLDRRPRAGRPAVAERAGGARVDRPVRRPRRRRLRRVRARTERGLLNQGWKDSGDAIRDRTGRWPRPIALAEVQGYVFDAKRRMAASPASAGRRDLAAPRARPSRCASASRRRSGWRTRALRDGPRRRQAARPTRSARTPGTACGPGSSSPARARRVADGCWRPTMFTGWGIRTLAPGQLGYNPIGYHTGTVWPHDTR